MPAILEPHGLDRGDGKRPDGMTIFPFAMGRCLIWDATCVNTYANSRLISAAVQAGAAAGDAEAEKRRKYADLCQRFRFEPIAFETSGSCGPSTKKLLREIGAQMSAATGERRETEWLLQRCSIAVARGNAASILLTTTGSSRKENTGLVLSSCPPPVNASKKIPNETSEREDEASCPGTAVTATRRGIDAASLLWESEQEVSPPAAHLTINPSRNPLDDPDLARYLLPRAPVPLADPTELSS